MQSREFLNFVALKIASATVVFGSIISASQPTLASAASIGQQLISAARAAGIHRLTPTHEPVIDTLRNSRSHWININLYSGTAYNLVGVCDEYCTDVDVKLYDENYNLVDADTRSSDLAVISVVPRWSGQFHVEIDMASCNANYCYYGMGIFGR